jgi:hypothetical protein
MAGTPDYLRSAENQGSIMLRRIFILPCLLASAAMAFSELPDSSGRKMGLDSLARKVDSLEASLTRLRFDLQDRSPYVNGAALKWGRGLAVGVRFHQMGPDLELRYTFRNGMDPEAGTRRFGLSRWTIVAGSRSVPDWDIPRFNQFTPGAPTTAGFVGLRMSSPIFLNFVSTEFGEDLYWSNPRKTWKPGWSQSMEIQFWVSKIMHVNLGTVSNVEFRNQDNRVIDIFRPYMGFAISLFQPLDKSPVTVK